MYKTLPLDISEKSQRQKRVQSNSMFCKHYRCQHWNYTYLSAEGKTILLDWHPADNPQLPAITPSFYWHSNYRNDSSQNVSSSISRIDSIILHPVVGLTLLQVIRTKGRNFCADNWIFLLGYWNCEIDVCNCFWSICNRIGSTFFLSRDIALPNGKIDMIPID